MPRYEVVVDTDILSSGGTVVLSGQEGRHLARVRRIRRGAVARLKDGLGLAFSAMVMSVRGEKVVFELVEQVPCPDDTLPLVLMPAVIKGKRMDWLIQKACELGVRGIRLKGDDILIGVVCVNEEQQLFLISEKGYGKRTEFRDFNSHGRGTQGQKAYNVNEKSGALVAALSVNGRDSLICISTLGKAIKLNLDNISIIGRNAFGVRIVNIGDNDTLVGVAAQQNEIG
jgi:DNA gyrase/topoisomerase IV subunit A